MLRNALMTDDVVETVQLDDSAEAYVPGPLDTGLLAFQQDCIEALLRDDGLTVLGHGLGLSTITAALLAVHHQTTDSGGSVVMLGTASDSHHTRYNSV